MAIVFTLSEASIIWSACCDGTPSGREITAAMKERRLPASALLAIRSSRTRFHQAVDIRPRTGHTHAPNGHDRRRR
ncbi:MAG: hypothetical protein ACRDIL_08655, partial [Candidatus Limnocylindrales bacterium]